MSDLLHACEAFRSLNLELSSGDMSDEVCYELIEARSEILDTVLELDPRNEAERDAKIVLLLSSAIDRTKASGDLRTASLIANLWQTVFNQKFSSPLPFPAGSQGVWNSFSS